MRWRLSNLLEGRHHSSMGHSSYRGYSMHEFQLWLHLSFSGPREIFFSSILFQVHWPMYSTDFLPLYELGYGGRFSHLHVSDEYLLSLPHEGISTQRLADKIFFINRFAFCKIVYILRSHLDAGFVHITCSCAGTKWQFPIFLVL